jgi:2'-5' RNA ligase
VEEIATEHGRFVGQTALIVTVPEVGFLVDRWRSLHDPTAVGVPPHVTVLYPFLPDGLVDASVIETLTAIFARHGAFAVAFTHSARFPGTYYLAPEPAAPLSALTLDVAAHWPEAQPYGGAFDRIVPHLTVAHSADELLHRRIDRAISPLLPVSTVVRDIQLIAATTAGWVHRASFDLGSGVAALRRTAAVRSLRG